MESYETPFKLKSGNITPFKQMGSSSPLLGCAEDPTGKGCGNFKVRGQGKKKIKKAISDVKKKISNIFRGKKKPLTNEQKLAAYNKPVVVKQPVRDRPAAKRVDVAKAETEAKNLNIVNPYVGGTKSGT